ncbi:hypothetical protein KGF54_004831 [Candida jiufengensis]|uniref:uncharacterized protein n=1 Tax=Candida jiufengensis TaxID=497108 RepID=UPI002224478E|nr:uncharacterized protein KGF54_004831 [Candida jiufengensis]KAI5951756.1 hypothetical protein KGF54_004831 [Candida jiufengensis]
MTQPDIYKHLIFCTLTINSSTLYTYENHQLTSTLPRMNCSEIISQELGLINSSKTLVGSIPVSMSSSLKLSLYFMKKYLNLDGSRDLITVVVIAHVGVNRTFILMILKNIMDKYIDFKSRQDDKNDQASKAKPGEFKLLMNQIIKYEEMNFDSNQQNYNYGSTNDQNDTNTSQINPNQLILANEEVGEVRQLMLENINKLLNRGDKINSLVDQTDRLNTSSSLFQKKAQQIKRRMWFHKAKFIVSIVVGILLIILYIFFSLYR